jgi:hypothetical protein
MKISRLSGENYGGKERREVSGDYMSQSRDLREWAMIGMNFLRLVTRCLKKSG